MFFRKRAGELLGQWRTFHNIGEGRAAKKVGVYIPYWRAVEAGQVDISLDMLEKMVRAIGVRPDLFWQGPMRFPPQDFLGCEGARRDRYFDLLN